MKPFLVLDLETAPQDRAVLLDPDEEWMQRGIRENFKPETVEQYRQKNQVEWAQEILRRSSLDWRLGQIVAAGHAIGTEWHGYPAAGLVLHLVVDEGGPTGVELTEALEKELPAFARPLVFAVPGERQLLMRTWAGLAEYPRHQLSGFCLRTFDLPWLLGRSATQDVAPPHRISSARYQHDHLVDWADVLTWYDAFSRRGWTLTDYADWFDLPYRPWGEGKDLVGWLDAGDYLSIAKHLAFDLLTSHALHARFAPAFLKE